MKDQNLLVPITLPAGTWREIEKELRERGVWWLANQLVNTNSPVFREVSGG
jgi:hypothetical protein